MLNRYFYLKLADLGMDKFGRFTDDVGAWKIYTSRREVFHMMKDYPGSTIGIL